MNIVKQPAPPEERILREILQLFYHFSGPGFVGPPKQKNTRNNISYFNEHGTDEISTESLFLCDVAKRVCKMANTFINSQPCRYTTVNRYCCRVALSPCMFRIARRIVVVRKPIIVIIITTHADYTGCFRI